MMMTATFSFANEASDDRMNRAAFESQLTRDAVRAEYLQARSEGTLIDTSEAGSVHRTLYTAQGMPATRLTRQQVAAEYIEARADGSLVDTSEAGSMHAPVFANARQASPEIFAGALAEAGPSESE